MILNLNSRWQGLPSTLLWDANRLRCFRPRENIRPEPETGEWNRDKGLTIYHPIIVHRWKKRQDSCPPIFVSMAANFSVVKVFSAIFWRLFERVIENTFSSFQNGLALSIKINDYNTILELIPDKGVVHKWRQPLECEILRNVMTLQTWFTCVWRHLWATHNQTN